MGRSELDVCAHPLSVLRPPSSSIGRHDRKELSHHG
jgi:hypothetical protein